jgi:hypothetical protein
MLTHPTKLIALCLTNVLLFTACGDGTTGPREGTATLSVYLTDAPGDVENVWVELLGLTAQGGEGGGMELLGEPTDMILLTDLVGTVQLLSVNAELDPSVVRQFRLVVGDAVLETRDGEVYVKGDPTLPAGLEPETVGELHCPSCSQSGIKVKVPHDEIEVGEGEAALVIDFDVSQSFGHKAGNSGKWVMKPVILGTLVEDENGNGSVLDEIGMVGSVTGTVRLGTNVTIPECPAGTATSIVDFVPTATIQGLLDGEGNPIVRAGSVAEGGAFQIGFLPPGTFSMGYVASIDLTTDHLVFTAEVMPTEVTVNDGEVSGLTYTIQSAECQPAG